MVIDPEIPLVSLVMCTSKALDLVSSVLVNYYRIAYIAYCLGLETGLENKQLHELVLAGALHDIGVFSLREKLSI